MVVAQADQGIEGKVAVTNDQYLRLKDIDMSLVMRKDKNVPTNIRKNEAKGKLKDITNHQTVKAVQLTVIGTEGLGRIVLVVEIDELDVD